METAPYRPHADDRRGRARHCARGAAVVASRTTPAPQNLRVTSGAVEEIIEGARAKQRKPIVFLTGVPGAGETLVGLNVATRRRDLGEARAVFLSGNGPLVAVLQEALTRDELARSGKHVRKGTIRQQVKPFIQNVHHFRDEGLRDPGAPFGASVIFDEAQRAWDRAKTADFMRRRKKRPDFSQSEPEFLISYLDRHRDWAVIICLVGGGQEIHTAKLGSALGSKLCASLSVTGTCISRQIWWMPSTHLGAAVDAFGESPRLVQDRRLHLSTSMRSFRSEKVSAFVKAASGLRWRDSRHLLQEVSARYPVALTRDLPRAKQWIRDHARGSERYGLVASSQALRLKPHAIDVRVNVDPIHWFLNDRNDTRSSYYLEDAATEFQIQGLELDWICVTWDADLRLEGRCWRYHAFRGDGWTTIHKEDRKRYLLNAYRVLLTRARQAW